MHLFHIFLKWSLNVKKMRQLLISKIKKLVKRPSLTLLFKNYFHKLWNHAFQIATNSTILMNPAQMSGVITLYSGKCFVGLLHYPKVGIVCSSHLRQVPSAVARTSRSL